MDDLIYYGMDSLIGNPIADAVAKWIIELFEKVKPFFETNGGMSQFVTIFSGIAGALLVLYFFIDIISQASRDLLSIDRLVVALIKLVAALAVLVSLQSIIYYIIDFGQNMVIWMSYGGSGGGVGIFKNAFKNKNALSSKKGNNYYNGFYFFVKDQKTWPNHDKFLTLHDSDAGIEEGKALKYYTGIFSFFRSFSLVLKLAMPMLISLAARLAGYFLATSNMAMLIVRCVFSPLAVVQLFEDGSRSAGIRYLKGIFADALSFSIIIVILQVCSYMNNIFLSDTFKYLVDHDIKGVYGYDSDHHNVGDVFTLTNCAKLLVPQLVTVGGMGGAIKISHDIMGA